MSTLNALRAEMLADGRITDREVAVIRRHIEADGRLDLDDMRVLVELLADASEVCPAFDELFFPALREIVLRDGRIGPDEQFYLLKMLYSDGRLRPCELEFLLELRESVAEATPEFESLCEAALEAHPTNWDVGGR